MSRRLKRHGCLVLTCLVCPAGSLRAQDPIKVQSPAFDIEYEVNEDALPLSSVSLWFTADRGSTWQKFADDEDRQSPVTFQAPADGLYGLYLIAGNATGPSSFSPTSRTEPHVWVFVDSTPPIVQLHTLRPAVVLGKRVVQVRWTAVDAHLGPRPIEVMFRRGSNDAWQPAAPQPLANTGRYDWPVPAGLGGTIAMRLTVVDRGGHRVSSEPHTLDLTEFPVDEAPPPPPIVDSTPPAVPDPAPRTVPDAAPRVIPVSDAGPQPGSIRANERASRLYREAMEHRERGEYLQGVARLREAVKLKPHWADAFAQMADMLYRLGDLDRAKEAYDVALRQQPGMRSALRGLAMVYRQRSDYSAAAQSLRAILRYDPGDVEVWMNLGDIAIYQGNDILARECYMRATQMDPSETKVVSEARKRLELMADVSRRYAPHSD